MKNLREKFRKIDFLIPFGIGVLIFKLLYNSAEVGNCKYSSYCIYRIIATGLILFILASILSHLRWKFVYGSKEYRTKLTENYKSQKSNKQRLHQMLGWGYIEGAIFIVLLTSYMLVLSLFKHNYLIALILLGVGLFFITTLVFHVYKNIKLTLILLGSTILYAVIVLFFML